MFPDDPTSPGDPTPPGAPTPPPGGGGAGSQYFSAAPGGAQRRRTITVVLRGTERDVVTAGGVFSAERLDLGTRVLLREAPPPPAAGDLLDLGCGWGPLTLALAEASPSARVWAVDVNPRALDLVRENAASMGSVTAATPDDVPDGIRFAAIWSNPPIRIGKEALHALLLRWLPRLEPGAHAHLVVQRNLGADSLQAWLAATLGENWTVVRAGSAKGYRILRVTAPV